MFSNVVFGIGRLLRRLLIVNIVALAAYVSAGRQFMPAVADYTQFVEEKVFELTGLPVNIASLTGSFSGFNPTIQVSGLSLLVTEAQIGTATESGGLVFDRAMLTLDVLASLWQRRWVLEEFEVADLDVALRQSPSGVWQLRGVSGTTPQRVDMDELYSILLGVSYLQLSDVALRLEPNTGAPVVVDVIDARIQNRDSDHVFLFDARIDGVRQPLQFSYEGTGATLADASAYAYANIPSGDYLPLFDSLLPASIQPALAGVTTLNAGGEIWLELSNGKLVEATATLDIESLELQRPSAKEAQTTELSSFRSVATIRQSDESVQAGGLAPRFEFVIQANQGKWDGEEWGTFSAGFVLRQDGELELRADSLDLARILSLTQRMANAGFIPLTQSQLATMNTLSPRGLLSNLSVTLTGQEKAASPLEALSGPIQKLSLRANTEGGAVDSLGAIPMLDGVTGYLEIEYDGETQSASGFAEIDTPSLQMNLPNIYTRDWSYDYVNGRIDFLSLFNAGLDLRLSSNTVVAESESTKGRVQFSSHLVRPLEGVPESTIELLIGVEQMSADDRYYYLPDGPRIEPGLKTTMSWVGGAALGGTFFDSGAIFRGSTLPGADPATKTFQSFYRLRDGTIRYADGWPVIEEVEAFVATADNLIDVVVRAGQSHGLQLSGAKGSVRPDIGEDGEFRNKLVVDGGAAGLTQQAIDFLIASPLPEGLTTTVSNWRAEGDAEVAIDVEMLLGAGTGVDVRTELSIDESELALLDYGLNVSGLSGRVVFDTRTGLDSEALRGEMFDSPLAMQLGSVQANSVIETITLAANGSVAPEQLADLALTSPLVDTMLQQAEGVLEYQGLLSIEQGSESLYPTTLTVQSTLEGVTIAGPDPLAKEATDVIDFDLSLGFGESGQWHRGQLGKRLAFDLSFNDETLTQGLVFLGESPTQLSVLKQNPYDGLVLLGSLPAAEFEQWEGFVAKFSENLQTLAIEQGEADGSSYGVEAFASNLGFVDIAVDEFGLLGQSFANQSLRVRPNVESKNWLVDLAGPELEGHVEVPFAEGEMLVALQKLRLAGDESSTIGPQRKVENATNAAPIDSLAELDPRLFPAMRFSAREIIIGDSPYGSWRFRLKPDANGAGLSALAFDFRGLQLEAQQLAVERIDNWAEQETANADSSPQPAVAPSFYWHFDGENHRSEFSGRLHVADLGEVLRANGYAPSLESNAGDFESQLEWPGTPAFFNAEHLSGEIKIDIKEGRFLQGSGGAGALKLISILNFDAIMRRLRFSDDLLRSGLAFEQIDGHLLLDEGQVQIQDRLVISGPSSLYQITGDVDLVAETIIGEMYVTLPVSDNIPWLGLLTANIPIAVGAYLFDRIFGDQVDSLTSAAYILDGPWEGLEPQFKQAFGSPDVPAVPEASAPIRNP